MRSVSRLRELHPAARGAAVGGGLVVLGILALLLRAAGSWAFGHETVTGENETGFWLIVGGTFTAGTALVALFAAVGAGIGVLARLAMRCRGSR